MEDERIETTGAAGEASTAAPAEQPEGPAELANLKQQRDDYYDRLLRKTAEFDNYRKRTERERLQLSEAAAADLLEELLPLVDDMERALKAELPAEASAAARRSAEASAKAGLSAEASAKAGAGDGIRKGVELIHRQLLDILRKRGVKPIEALGADFDPHVHNAVAHEPADGRRDGEVVEEFRRGYLLGDRLLRPAMVKVAKA